jgi:ATP-dependent Clp protease ATP-binding subunit ClpC
VGKTELAKQLAQFLFGSEDALISLDMSEYMEKHTVSRLVGSPPGYVGFEEGGQLTELVRRKPYSVILFDEIEKAHPDVFNVLLQILEEGRLTDAQGRKIDFKNAIIIMTSNVGARDIAKGKTALGFGTSGQELDHEAIKGRVTGELKKLFRPELLNRVDEVIVFHELTTDEIGSIVDLMIDDLRTHLFSRGIGVKLTPEAREVLAKEGFDPTSGARPLRRAIQRLVEDPLSEEMLAGQWSPGDVVELTAVDGKVVFAHGNGAVETPKPAEKASRKKAMMPPRTTAGGGSGSASSGASGE